MFWIFFYEFLRLETRNLGPLARGHLGALDLYLNSHWLRSTRQCYIPYFKHLGRVVRKKKNLEYITKHLYGSNLGPSGAGPSWTLVPWFEQTWYKITWQCYIPNFKHLSQVVLEKILKYISFLNPRPPSQGHFRPQGHYLYKLSRGLLGNATYQISGLYA